MDIPGISRIPISCPRGQVFRCHSDCNGPAVPARLRLARARDWGGHGQPTAVGQEQDSGQEISSKMCNISSVAFWIQLHPELHLGYTAEFAKLRES